MEKVTYETLKEDTALIGKPKLKLLVCPANQGG